MTSRYPAPPRAQSSPGTPRLSASGGIRSTLPERRSPGPRALVVAVACLVIVGAILGATGRYDLFALGFSSEEEPAEADLDARFEEDGDGQPAAEREPEQPGDDEPPSERRLPLPEFLDNAQLMLGNLPTLEELPGLTDEPAVADDIDEQLAHIAELDRLVTVTYEGFLEFALDTSRRGVFADAQNYHESIEPGMFVVHWTAAGYTDVDHFVQSITPHRVQFFIDDQAQVYDLFTDDRRWPAHALGVNEFAQGVEIESGEFDGERSPLFGITPEQLTQTVYLAVAFLHRNDLPVDETTIVGHFAADLIFANPHYDPYDGTLGPDGTIRKFDPPEELMAVIVRHATTLDATLRRSEVPDWRS